MIIEIDYDNNNNNIQQAYKIIIMIIEIDYGGFNNSNTNNT